MLFLSRPLVLLLTTLGIAVFGMLACCFLPHDRYIRFQTVATESDYYVPLKWIYERIHFDTTPIDIAFVGTSHTQSGVKSEVVDAALREHHADLHSVNLALPVPGRDIEYLLAKELIESRPIRTLVIELQEDEPIDPHPCFQRLADGWDLLSAPVLWNSGLVDNFVRLPERNLALFIRSWFPTLFGLHRRFDSADYVGPYWDDTYAMHTREGLGDPRTVIHPPAFFDPYIANLKKVAEQNSALARRLSILPLRDNLLYRYHIIYLRAMIALAREHGVKVVFLYLPSLHGQEEPHDAAEFRQSGPILVPHAALEDIGLWQNVGHFNAFGAVQVSRWLGGVLAELASSSGP